MPPLRRTCSRSPARRAAASLRRPAATRTSCAKSRAAGCCTSVAASSKWAARAERTVRLHVTNGDAAVERIRAAGIAGTYLPWRDVLHDGPVPDDVDAATLRAIRARFIADAGWAPYDDA